MLFLGGDLIEAGLCPLKLPRYSMVFPAEDRFFDSLPTAGAKASAVVFCVFAALSFAHCAASAADKQKRLPLSGELSTERSFVD